MLYPLMISKSIEITEELASYINDLLDHDETEKMRVTRLETEAFDHGEMQAPISQLRVIISIMQMIDARRVLEVGTFRGMTAARLAEALPDIAGAKVVTLEKDLRYIDELKKRWTDLGVDKKIDLRSGQALDLLDQLAGEVDTEGHFDLAFIDADKDKYKLYVEKTLSIMRPRGVILIDNTLWGGAVVGSSTDSNITKNIQNFNTWIFETFGLQASIVPAWDGMTIIVKK